MSLRLRAVSWSLVILIVSSALVGFAPPAAAASLTQWVGPLALESAPNDTLQPQLAVSADGTSMFVWVQNTSTSPFIAASLYTPGSGLSAPANISWGLAASQPRIAAADAGRFLAVWVGTNNVSMNWYAPASGWGGPTLLYAAGAAVGSVSVAADSTGRAVVAWSAGTFPQRVQVTLYVPSLGWSAPTQFTGNLQMNSVSVALSGNGGAALAWRENDFTNARISAAVLAAGASWSTASPATPNAPSGNYAEFAPSVAMLSNGTVLLVARVPGSVFAANRFVPGFGWQAASALRAINGGGAVNAPSLDLDAAGNGVVAVTEATPNASFSAELFLYSAATNAWSNLTVPGSGYPSGNTAAALDPDGRMFVAWSDLVGAAYLARAQRFDPSGGWQAAVDLGGAGDVSVANASSLRVAVGDRGDAAATWLYNSTGAIDAFAEVLERDSVAPLLTVRTPLPGLTNASLLSVSGTTDLTATLTVDGAAVAVDGITGDFSTHVAHPEGPHTFTVVASDADGNTATFILPVWVDRIAPPLAVNTPSDGAALSVGAVAVQGVTEPGSLLTVNGVQALVALDGSFTMVVALDEGPNTIAVSARDAAGNTAARSLLVTYTNPLAASLAQTQADLADLQNVVASANASVAAATTALASANADLSAATADLAAAEAQLASAQAQVNASQGELDQAQAALTSAQANYTAAQAQATVSANALAGAQSAYVEAQGRADALSLQFNATLLALQGRDDAVNRSKADAAAAQAQASAAGGLASTSLLLALAAIAVAAFAVVRARPRHDEEKPRRPERGRRSKDNDEDD